MVKKFTSAILIAGITPGALADFSGIDLDNKLQAVSSSKALCNNLPASFCNFQFNSRDFVFGVHSDILSLQNIATSVLPNPAFMACDRQAYLKDNRYKPNLQTSASNLLLELRNTNLPLSSLETITNPVCSFTWQQQLDREPIALKLSKVEDITAKQDNAGVSVKQNFPSLSRSSLIVSFPQTNSTFTPRQTKLANPAPKTKRIASPFGWRSRPYSNQRQFHQGIDYGAPYGSPVVSVGNGIVTRVVEGCADFSNLFCGGQLGNWIEIDHGNGKIGTYGHLKYSSITVTEGMRVSKNQSIAQVGSSGWSTGAHLDFRFKVNGKHENPAKYVMDIDRRSAKKS